MTDIQVVTVANPINTVKVADGIGITNTSTQINLVKLNDVPTNVTIVNNPTTVVTIGVQGPQGPSGDSGGSYKTVSSDYYITLPTDNSVGVDANSGLVNVYLPLSVNGNKGNEVSIKKIDNSSNHVLVQTTNGQLLDGNGSSFSISSQEESYDFTSTGDSYIIS